MSEVESYLKIWSKQEPSEIARRVGELLHVWDGIHHFEQDLMRKVDWSHPHFISMPYRGDLATFDSEMLTRLVFLAHDYCIRVSIMPKTSSLLQIMFHPRSSRDGGLARRHPTLECAVAEYRRYQSAPGELEVAK